MKHLQRLTVVALGGAAALFAAGCDGSNSVRIASTNDTTDGALRQIETLQCPQEVGPLVRRGAAADGLSCTYAGPRGAEVTLRLVSLAEGQTLAQALSPLEQELRVLMPQAVARASQPDAAQAAALRAAGAQVDAAERVAQEAARTGDEAARAAQGAGESVDVRAPGLTVRSEGENTEVRLPGISVDSTETGAKIRVGGLRIDANDGSGQVQIDSDDESVRVRASNEAAEIRTAGQGEGLRSTYIIVDDRPGSAGWRLVGLEARGPAGGPLVVAVVRSKDRRENDVFDAAKELLTLNVGR